VGQSVIPTEAQLDYMRRTGDISIDGANSVGNARGFASYKVGEKSILIIQTYGDGKYWDKFFRDKAKEHGVKFCMFYTRRNPKAFARRFGAEVVQTLMQVEVSHNE